MRYNYLIHLGLMSFVILSCGQEQTKSSLEIDRFSNEATASSKASASSETPVSGEAAAPTDLQVETQSKPPKVGMAPLYPITPLSILR